MNWKVLAAVAMIAVGVGAMVFVVVRPDVGASQATQYLTGTVTRTDVTKTATASGTLSAHGTYGLAFGSDPQPIASSTSTGGSGGSGGTWLVRTVSATVGAKVAKGTVLATADTTDAQLQVTIAQANLAAAKARLAVDRGGSQALVVAAARNQLAQSQLAYTSAQHTRQSTLQQNDDSVTQATQALADAQAQLATAEAGPSQADITAAQDALAAAQLQYSSAVSSANDSQSQNSLAVSQAASSVSDANAAVAAAQQKLNADQAALTQAENATPVDPTAVSAAQAAVTADQQALNQALQTQTQAQNGYDSTSVKSASGNDQVSNQIALAQQALTSAQHQYQAKIAPSQSAIDAANQAIQQAELNLQLAQQKQAASVTQLADQLSQAQLQLASAQNSYQQKIAPASPDQIASDKAAISSATVNLATAKQTLEGAKLVAPVDGTIVAVDVVAGIDAPSGYAITMQSGPLQVAADFAESDIPTIALGQQAQVTIAATKETAPGTVAQITPVAATSAGSSVVTYAVVVVLDPTPAAALAGMSASVAITTAQAQNVLAVPATALIGRNGNYGVRVMDAAGQVTTVQVQPGLVTNSLVEIQSGLSEGETVVVGTSSARQGTTTTGGGGLVGLPGLGGGGGFRDGGGTRAGTGTGGQNGGTAP